MGQDRLSRTEENAVTVRDGRPLVALCKTAIRRFDSGPCLLQDNNLRYDLLVCKAVAVACRLTPTLGYGAGCGTTRGNETVNADPLPNVLCAVRSPCMARASSRLIEKPKPVPSRSSSLPTWTKGSNIASTLSDGMLIQADDV